MLSAARLPRLGLIISLGLALPRCATPQQGAGEEDTAELSLGQGETLSSLDFAATAEGNWQRGEAAYNDESYLKAERYFRYVRNKFPYSHYALLADLRVADAMFQRERYREAIDAYQSFARMHPTHEEVPYTMFMVGKSYQARIPTDWFFLPPSYERDRANVHDAARSYAAFLRRYPKDERAPEAQTELDKLRKRLVAHERYVADFYKRDEHWPGYAGRLETIREEYGDVALTDALLLEMAQVYAKMERWEAMFEALDALKREFPDSKLAPKAQALAATVPGTPAPEAAPKTKTPAPEAAPKTPAPEAKAPEAKAPAPTAP